MDFIFATFTTKSIWSTFQDTMNVKSFYSLSKICIKFSNKVLFARIGCYTTWVSVVQVGIRFFQYFDCENSGLPLIVLGILNRIRGGHPRLTSPGATGGIVLNTEALHGSKCRKIRCIFSLSIVVSSTVLVLGWCLQVRCSMSRPCWSLAGGY